MPGIRVQEKRAVTAWHLLVPRCPEYIDVRTNSNPRSGVYIEDRMSPDLLNADPQNSRLAAPALAILVHGLWMSGLQLTLIKRRLEADGALRALSFSYPTIVGSMSDHVRRLIDCARAHRSERLHFVGHSLGGLVILRALQVTDDL